MGNALTAGTVIKWLEFHLLLFPRSYQKRPHFLFLGTARFGPDTLSCMSLVSDMGIRCRKFADRQLLLKALMVR
jgi:hypothetical protein